MYKYKLKQEYLNDGERTFPGVGTTKEGVIESATKLESPLLELVEGDQAAPVAQNPAPAPAAPISTATSQPQTTNNQEQK